MKVKCRYCKEEMCPSPINKHLEEKQYICWDCNRVIYINS